MRKDPVMALTAGCYIPGVGMVHLPSNFYRDSRKFAWRVVIRSPNRVKLSFSDATYGGADASFHAALRRHGEYYREWQLERRTRWHQREKPSKNEALGVVGVSHLIRELKGRDYHYFTISDPRGSKVSLYIGTEETYSTNWNTVFAAAVRLRKEFERAYCKVHKYKMYMTV